MSHSSGQTEQLAASLGSRLRGGEVIELVSDVGAGKTTFVRGLARGLGSPDKVSSPSFTLSNEYSVNLKGPSFQVRRLVHIDFYRLYEPGIMKDELAEIVADPQAVTVVEWADIVDDVLPGDRLTIRLSTIGETERKISFEYPESLKYLMEKA